MVILANNPAAALQKLLATKGAGAHGRVAVLVGESSASWSRYCGGKKKPGAGKLAEWTERTSTMLVCTGGVWGAMHAPKAGR